MDSNNGYIMTKEGKCVTEQEYFDTHTTECTEIWDNDTQQNIVTCTTYCDDDE